VGRAEGRKDFERGVRTEPYMDSLADYSGLGGLGWRVLTSHRALGRRSRTLLTLRALQLLQQGGMDPLRPVGTGAVFGAEEAPAIAERVLGWPTARPGNSYDAGMAHN